MSRGGAEAGRSGAKVSRGVPPSARAAAGPMGAGRVRTRAQPPHPPPQPEPGEAQRQEEERHFQEAQAEGQERREDQHAPRYAPGHIQEGQNNSQKIQEFQNSNSQKGKNPGSQF